MKRLRLSRMVGLAAGVTVLGLVLRLPSDATASITFAGSDSSHSAQATFGVDGSGDLIVTISNMQSTTGIFTQTNVLTALFFSVTGDPTLTPLSASTGASKVWHPDGTNMGQNWEYLANKSGLGSSVTQHDGISATGFNIFGQGNFCTSGSGKNVDGVGWGLMPQTTTNFTYDGFSTTPFIQSTAVFILSGFGSTSLSNIGKVEFQYGTSLCDTSLCGSIVNTPSDGTADTPEPPTFAVWLVLGSLGVGFAWWRRKRAAYRSQS